MQHSPHSSRPTVNICGEGHLRKSKIKASSGLDSSGFFPPHLPLSSAEAVASCLTTSIWHQRRNSSTPDTKEWRGKTLLTADISNIRASLL